jgi:hypothetical protein
MTGGKGFGHPDRPSSSKASFACDPLSLVNREKLPGLLNQIGSSATERYKELLTEIRRIMAGSEPLQILAILASHGLTMSINNEGRQRRILNDDSFSQQHVEQAQAISLTISPADFKDGDVSSADVQLLFDLLPELGNSYSLHRLSRPRSAKTEEEGAIDLLQQYLRLYTQGVRNWGHIDDVIKIVREMLDPLDQDIHHSLGFPGSSLIHCFSKLIEISEERLKLWIFELHKILSAKNTTSMLKIWLSSDNNPDESLFQVSKIVKNHQLSRIQVKTMILEHRSMLLKDIYLFSIPELASILSLDEPMIEMIFENLSMSFGELEYLVSENRISDIFLSNPVWSKPIVRLGDGQYFCPMPQLFFSYIYPIIGELFSKDKSLKKKYEMRRADYLEEQVAALFSKAFPNSKILRGYKWRHGNVEYESDIIVYFDSFLLLIEAKSGSISSSALRGGPGRAKKHVTQLIYEPSRQSERLLEHLTETFDHKQSDYVIKDVTIDAKRINKVLRLSITLEDFATIQSNLGLVRQTGWIPKEHVLAPCMTLMDLSVIIDILNAPWRILYYLGLRAQIEESFSYTGNELELLGLFLTSDVNSCISASTEAHLFLSGMSKDVDQFYISQSAGISAKKPELRQTKLFCDIEKKIASSMQHGWMDSLEIILGCSYREQEKLLKMFSWVKKNVRKHRNQPDHHCSVVLGPYGLRRNGLIFYGFHTSDSEARHDRISILADRFFSETDSKLCLILGFRIDVDDYPYSILALASNPKTGKSQDASLC